MLIKKIKHSIILWFGVHPPCLQETSCRQCHLVGPSSADPSPMGRKKRVQPEDLEQSKSSARKHDCREGRHNPPIFPQNLFQAAHLGLLTVEANLSPHRLIRKKIPFACPPLPLGPHAGTSLASVCKPQCIQTSLVQHYILVFSTPLMASSG